MAVLYGRFLVVSYTKAVAHLIMSSIKDCRIQIVAPPKPPTPLLF